MKKRKMRAEAKIALFFLLPAVIGMLAFFYYPILQTMIYSVFRLRRTTNWMTQPFIGLQNYIQVFKTEAFRKSLGFTTYYATVSVILELAIGLGMAMATFYVPRKLGGILRSMIVIPWAIPPIITAMLWKWLFNSQVGLWGNLLVSLGLAETSPQFLTRPFLAMHSVIVADIWKFSSIMAIFMLAGLASIPQDVYDAAKVDGARSWFRFRRVTLPLLAPTILVALLFRAMDALKVFEIVYGLTGGGPGTTTETLSSFAYKFYFSYAKFGQGSAYAMVVFFFLVVLGSIYLNRIRGNLRF